MVEWLKVERQGRLWNHTCIFGLTDTSIISLYWLKNFQQIKKHNLIQLMKSWYLSHRRPAKVLASLCICAVSPEPSLLAHMKYGSRWKVQPKIRHLAPLMAAHVCLKNEFMEDKKCHNLMRWLIYVCCRPYTWPTICLMLLDRHRKKQKLR